MEKLELRILQQVRLAEIGQYLSQLRREQEILIDHISVQTKIQVYQLEAIEMGDVSCLPPAIYIQGFIKLYANALNINGTAIASTFPL
ncbi:MAG: helix-turn-helix transcriptional regulator [Cyanobacteria bacterium J06626_4]